jgi:hypothetical protein
LPSASEQKKLIRPPSRTVIRAMVTGGRTVYDVNCG